MISEEHTQGEAIHLWQVGEDLGGGGEIFQKMRRIDGAGDQRSYAGDLEDGFKMILQAQFMFQGWS